jgi:hypothetical protein
MKIGLQWPQQLIGSGPAGRWAHEEFKSLVGQLTGWSRREHTDEGQHGHVTATSVTVTALRDFALRVANGSSLIDGAMALSAAITPPQITVAQNDYSPPGIEDAFVLRLQSDAPRRITGIQDGPRSIPLAGRLLLVFNAGTSAIVLTHEDTDSRANFRFRLPNSTNASVSPNNCVLLAYDARARRWIMLARTTGDGTQFAEFNAGDSGAAIEIDFANGTQQILTLTADADITLVNGVEGIEYHLILVQDATGGRVPTWEANVLFENDDLTPEAIEPNDVLLVTLWYSAYNGGTYFAAYTPWETDLAYKNLTPATGPLLLLGRGAFGAGDWEEISLGSGLTMSGTVLDTLGSLGGGSGITQLTGDVTAGPGFGSQAATIANDAVTYAKMQNVSGVSLLLGRGSAGGAGDPEEISLGTGLTMSGTVLSSTGGGGAGTVGDLLDLVFVRKSADESLNTSVTLQNDDELLFAIGATETWTFEFVLFVVGITTNDFRVAVVGPAGSTGWYTAVRNVTGDPSSGNLGINASANYATPAGFISQTAVGVTGMVLVKGLIRTTGTSGTVNLQWAQGTSSGTDVTVEEDSYMEARRFA